MDFGTRIPVQITNAILFWPRDRIAMIREEHGSRLEVSAVDGEVAHRPGPLAALAGHPFVEAGPGVLVHPHYARKRGAFRHLPGGWRIPANGALPRPAPPPHALDEEVIAALGVRPAEVICLREVRPGAVYWHTEASTRRRSPAWGHQIPTTSASKRCWPP